MVDNGGLVRIMAGWSRRDILKAGARGGIAAAFAHLAPSVFASEDRETILFQPRLTTEPVLLDVFEVLGLKFSKFIPPCPLGILVKSV